MPGEDERRQSVRRAEDRVGRGEYAPRAVEEVSLPVDEGRAAHEIDIEDPANRAPDPDVLRDGGPTRNRGVATTTGGRKAGPASVRRRPRPPGGNVAPTTTGDATTGGMNTPASGSTSDASGQAAQVGDFTDK
ncbi:hypothetical protein O7626_09975 [Micromonospora sp. WMMD1102]|uniref:hypothetical protein n=1 Tax=Micromonospora sp. WMMD1102 TaxID=3016105 RepID=UPI0024150D28|nr:hypothetical protein [Micromonospora sp. WMMD1102]MDG4786250.1 hypothetical protein [Micromonospora sp. WMMD1102]